VTAANPPREPDECPRQPLDFRAYARTWAWDYMVVLAINPDLRARHPEWPLSLEEALRTGRKGPDRAAQADREAEP
jgi:hypothetical protein